MSSERYACDLRVDSRLRRALVAGGVLAWLAGCLLLPALPVPVLLKVSLASLWSASCWLELFGLTRGMARIDRIRITAAGEVWGIAADGERQPLELVAGSLVLQQSAWLRLRFPDGRATAEWLSRRRTGGEGWRLLQLLWRQRGGCFGRLPRS